MRFLIFFLPLISASLGYDKTLENIELNLNNSVRPCDDFYRHVCPDDLTEEQFLIDSTIQRFNDAIEPYYPKSFTNVVLAHSAESNRVRSDVTEKELRRQLLKRGIPFKDCADSTNLLLRRVYDRNTMKTRVEKSLGDLRKNAKLVAWYNYIGDEKNNFTKNEMEAKEMFVTVKNTMLKQLLNSAWVKKHKIDEKITKVINQIRYYSFKSNPRIEQAFVDFEVVYEKCTKEWITGHFNQEYDLCLLKAAKSTTARLKSGILDYHEELVIRTGVSAFNAALRNYRNSSGAINMVVVVFPSLYGFLETQDELRKLTSFGNILAHEVGHAIFENQVHFEESESPIDMECVREEMKRTCRMFKEDWLCLSGRKTLAEDAADFAARTTTLEMAEKLMQNTNNTNSPSINSPAQMFFYGIGTLWCHGEKQSLPNDFHSSGVVRVNGVLRQSEEFRSAFQCKAGDAMVMEEDKRCHLFGKFAHV